MSDGGRSRAGADSFRAMLRLARNGDDGRVGQLLENCHAYLLTIAQAELPSDLQAKLGASDLVQDTLVRGIDNFGEFRGQSEEELARWLRRILVNRLANIRDTYAATRRAAALEQRADSELIDLHAPRPSGRARAHEDEKRLTAAIQRLPEDYQRVIELRHREDCSFAQIATIMKTSASTARSQWAAAMQQLQRELGDEIP